ncbi:ABC transporter ATP-binding protein [bacterium]|nr:ABC transporter ATP-binding protein [bacterium]
MSDHILTLENVAKNFRSNWTFRARKAVQNVSLEIRRGESFGYLGHNGAGKTTTIKCILGLIHLTSGRIFFEGKQISKDVKARSKIGYLPEQPYFYDHLSVQETLEFFAALHEIPNKLQKDRIREVLKLVGLDDRSHSKVRTLSKGLQQRLGFAQAIVNQPSLLILDEPFSGLDPLGRRAMRELITDLNLAGTTIFMSSHILSDVAEICSRVSIMVKGEMKRILDLKDTAELKAKAYELVVSATKERAEVLSEFHRIATKVRQISSTTGVRLLFEFNNQEHAYLVLDKARNAQLMIEQFEQKRPSLEEIFIETTQA